MEPTSAAEIAAPCRFQAGLAVNFPFSGASLCWLSLELFYAPPAWQRQDGVPWDQETDMTSSRKKRSLVQWIASIGAGSKVLLWVGSVIVICAGIQGITALFGNELSILQSGKGRALLTLVALVNLLALMSTDHRSISEYGLAMGSDWMKQAIRGALYGGGAYCAIYLAAWMTGCLTLDLDVSPFKLFRKTVEGIVTSWPMAATEQVIFSGYLLFLLRSAMGRTAGICLTAAAFTAAVMSGKSTNYLTPEQFYWLACNLSMASMLFAVLRLETGTIVLPTGILAGVLMTSRVLGGSGLLREQWNSAWLDIFASGGDPRRSPVLAVILCGAFLGAVIRLRLRGEAQPRSGPALSAEFKKFVPFSNLSALAPIDLWIGQLIRARFRVEPIYLARLSWILFVSTINTIITLPERLLAGLVLRHQVPDPLLLVGVHRSGTTHLHNLLALDPQFSVPRNLHVLNPLGMLVMGWIVTPLLGLFMTMRRPMDAVRVHLFSPQEEEFAIASMTRSSPYWGFYFPREIAHHERLIYPEEMTIPERQSWNRAMMLFLRKLTFWRRRMPLLKSPYNTARVAAFRKLFPQTKVIHICRHPHATYRSNQHLAMEGLVSFQLQDQPADGYASRFLEHYRKQERIFQRDVAEMPRSDVAYIRYEDLVQDPIAEIKRLYEQLGLKYTEQFDRRLQGYLDSLSDYRPNKHRKLSPELQTKIDAVMGPYLEAWGYKQPAKSPARAA